MNQFMGAGEGGLGGQHGFPLEAWFWEMPVCTRIWTSAVVLVSLLTQCDIVSEYKLYYNPKMVFERHQVSSLPKAPAPKKMC
jgi:Derlin-2/3